MVSHEVVLPNDQPTIGTFLLHQCDQMARFFQHSDNENLPNGLQSFAKVGPKFSQIVNKPSKFAQDFENLAIMAKFRQIWSTDRNPGPTSLYPLNATAMRELFDVQKIFCIKEITKGVVQTF